MSATNSLALAVANLRILQRMLAARLGQNMSPGEHAECLALSHAMELLIAEADLSADALTVSREGEQ